MRLLDYAAPRFAQYVADESMGGVELDRKGAHLSLPAVNCVRRLLERRGYTVAHAPGAGNLVWALAVLEEMQWEHLVIVHVTSAEEGSPSTLSVKARDALRTLGERQVVRFTTRFVAASELPRWPLLVSCGYAAVDPGPPPRVRSAHSTMRRCPALNGPARLLARALAFNVHRLAE
jgi:hypothetical protein